MQRNPQAFLLDSGDKSLYIKVVVDSGGKSYYIRQQWIPQSLYRNPGLYNNTQHENKNSGFQRQAFIKKKERHRNLLLRQRISQSQQWIPLLCKRIPQFLTTAVFNSAFHCKILQNQHQIMFNQHLQLVFCFRTLYIRSWSSPTSTHQ